jgi:hypothetical protein
MALGLLSAFAGCENNSDPTAPADSTITVSANPQTVVVPTGQQGTTEVTATLRSKNGTRLPDQEMTFSTTAGTLVPPAETPLVTDDQGQAKCSLVTTSSATITARSGSISGTTQIQTAPGDLAQFVLAVGPVQELTSCNDQLTLTASVRTTTGDPVAGVLVIFDEVSSSVLTGSFSPGTQRTTDVAGEAVVTWEPNQSCETKCKAAGGDPNTMGNCGDLSFIASDITGTFESFPVTVFENIP